MDSTLTNLLITIISGAIGYLAKNFIDKKKEAQNEVSKERREHYQHFINIIIDLLKSTNKNFETNMEKDTFYLEKLFEFTKKYILYASPEVILDFNEFFQYVYNNKTQNENIFYRKLSRIIKSMRKDIGLSNNGLGDDGEKLFRALLNDYDKIIT